MPRFSEISMIRCLYKQINSTISITLQNGVSQYMTSATLIQASMYYQEYQMRETRMCILISVLSVLMWNHAYSRFLRGTQWCYLFAYIINGSHDISKSLSNLAIVGQYMTCLSCWENPLWNRIMGWWHMLVCSCY